MSDTRERWRIDDLVALAARALAGDYPGAPSGRVRDLPDARTVRWYTTLGLVDRPAEMRGRTAWYGPRHLAQLVAIKRLQAEGLPLGAIQRRLLGLSDRDLDRLARLPLRLSPAERLPARAAAPARRRARFWHPPAAADRAPVPVRQPDAARERGDDDDEDASALADLPPTTALHAIAIAPGVTLLLEGTPPPGPDDVRAVATAARVLLRELESRRLLRPAHPERTES